MNENNKINSIYTIADVVLKEKCNLVSEVCEFEVTRSNISYETE